MGLILVAVLLLVVDWSQTRFIASNPDRFYEKNRILGRHPRMAEVNIYFAACIGLFLAVQGLLYLEAAPRWIGMLISAVIIAMQLHCTINNYRIGIRFR